MMDLNKKLAAWAGFEVLGVIPAGVPKGSLWGEMDMTGFWRHPNEDTARKEIDFTESLDACFKWLVPRLIKDFATELILVFEYLPNHDCWTVAIEDGFYDHGEQKRVLACASDKEEALALCLAIEKLIK